VIHRRDGPGAGSSAGWPRRDGKGRHDDAGAWRPGFICYRREDAGYPAGWLFDQLTARLGADRVFKDVDSIEPGDDFAEVITEAVSSCAVLLAVIGGRWLAAAGPDGRRLDDPGDFVRLEIEAALARGVRLVPVLVDGARMPRPDQLPASLAPLARRQAIELSHARFSADLAGLLNVLDREVRPTPAREPPSGGAVPARARPGGKASPRPADASGALPAPLTRFRDDDAGFRRWREDNPDGYFLNTEHNPGPGYLMLHRSGCPHFTRSPLHWTKDYIKFCAPDQASLEEWASTLGDLRYCRTCFRKPATGSNHSPNRG
jgi:TIR domain